jgi:hypothetical protein
MVAVMNIQSAMNDIKIFSRNILAEIGSRAASELSGELPDYRQSSFGRWYEGVGREAFGQIPAFQEIGSPYSNLYLTARGVRMAMQSGDREEALRQGSDLSRLEGELLGKLDQLNAVVSQEQG